MTDSQPRKNWFLKHGYAYARFRPGYPLELALFLANTAPSRACAVDVGCGNGQLTNQLGAHFRQVFGLDPSVDQIVNAPTCPGVQYVCAPAETIPLPSGSACLITAAQAAHWFDLPAFYAEVRRIGTKGATLALVSYGAPQLPKELLDRFSHFYHHEIGPYWPPEREQVDNGYRDMSFPFQERQAPRMDIRRTWDLSDFLGYLSTWSAVQRAKDAGRADILADFGTDMCHLWGDPKKKQLVSWPISMKIGRL